MLVPKFISNKLYQCHMIDFPLLNSNVSALSPLSHSNNLQCLKNNFTKKIESYTMHLVSSLISSSRPRPLPLPQPICMGFLKYTVLEY